MTASSKPCLMLIGDSIRMIYQPFVARMLAGQAEVVGPAENARFALYTLQRLSFWLEELPPPILISSREAQRRTSVRATVVPS